MKNPVINKQDKIKLEIEAWIELAFEAGRWRGQVDLEEFYDNDQIVPSILGSIYARKMSMPLHPPSIDKRETTISLRSDKWREGVKKSSNEYLEKVKTRVREILNKHENKDIYSWKDNRA